MNAASNSVSKDVNGGGWPEIWRGRQARPGDSIGLGELLAADGYDSGFGVITEKAWRVHVGRWVELLGLQSGMSVYEIGCGAGAFLHGLYELGFEVGGLDISKGLIDVARRAMPTGDFRVAEAESFAGTRSVDVVVASSVFQYFPSESYAYDVLKNMAMAARHAVLVLDLPDEERRDADIARRMAVMGGPEKYEARYHGLDHRYYRRATMTRLLADEGYPQADAWDVSIDGYGNAAYRFDLLGRRDAV